MDFQSNFTVDKQALRWSTAEVRKVIDKSVILLNICFVQCPVWESQEIKNLSLTFIQWTEMANVQQEPTTVRWDVPSQVYTHLTEMLIGELLYKLGIYFLHHLWRQQQSHSTT